MEYLQAGWGRRFRLPAEMVILKSLYPQNDTVRHKWPAPRFWGILVIMRLVGFLAALLAAQGSLCAASAPYQHRREELRKALKNGITVMFGRTARDSSDLRSSFYQEPNFYYLTGWMEPSAILLLSSKEPREILFVPSRDLDEEIWTGRKHGPDDADIGALTGFQNVMPAERFESEFRRLLEQYPKLYALADRPEAAKLKALAPPRDISN